jgi:hypothetical protein
MRAPHWYLSSVPPVSGRQRLIPPPDHQNHPLRDLHDPADYQAVENQEHSAVTKATLIAMHKMIQTTENRYTPDVEQVANHSCSSWGDLQQPDVSEQIVVDYLYPQVGLEAWRAFMRYEREDRHDLTYYMIYGEKLE